MFYLFDICNLYVSLSADILIGGPPCQDFSVLRGEDKRSGFTVERGKLYEQYLRILKIANPSIFVFENVVGMVSANEGLAYETIKNDFLNQGYDLIYNQVLNISDIGAPQSRRRLIIIGIKKNLVPNMKEVEKIVDFVKSNGVATYNEDILEEIEKSNKSEGQIEQESEDDDADPFLQEAINTVVETGQASTSFIQRRFKVGYARAGRIIDQMEERGVISGYQGSKPREVLWTMEKLAELSMSGGANSTQEE